MISPSEAEAAIRAHAGLLEPESHDLVHLTGAVLREPIAASRDQPPFDRVTMDGIAFASDSGRREFRIAGTQAAGGHRMVLASTDACFEVMTGAVVPTGCDCVVPVERIAVKEGVAKLADDVVATPGMNIHPRGLDSRAGDVLLEPGVRLGPPEVAVIASAGLSRAQVSRCPRIIVISTGDELVEPGEPANDVQIYRSNAYGVLAALQRRGQMFLAHDHIPDDLDVLRERLRAHLDTHDVLILSGGVSMGKFDFVPQVLTELGIRQVFHKIAQKPGKPMWFGVGESGGQRRTVYALPGNPVSTLVCLMRYVYPGLTAALGEAPAEPEKIALADAFDVKPALTVFIPVEIVADATGERRAHLRPTKGSGDFTSLIGTDGFVELPAGPVTVGRGTAVPLYRW
ncbi:molybdopterin molybdotransferase [Povalibacter uvarum]|uniref:Molybdopterin molybdenumtransferase n=1 Tax=Povalibacter uvarum TaxID=732238 RepID=A0A841HK49_9GAMM|nr:molybdopterin molybdotransferase MoeA [Povalibacter uvarum]MBB6093581.1 molybdopterin molybdotransferase [Povalibacter uvarum]